MLVRWLAEQTHDLQGSATGHAGKQQPNATWLSAFASHTKHAAERAPLGQGSLRDSRGSRGGLPNASSGRQAARAQRQLTLECLQKRHSTDVAVLCRRSWPSHAHTGPLTLYILPLHPDHQTFHPPTHPPPSPHARTTHTRARAPGTLGP